MDKKNAKQQQQDKALDVKEVKVRKLRIKTHIKAAQSKPYRSPT